MNNKVISAFLSLGAKSILLNSSRIHHHKNVPLGIRIILSWRQLRRSRYKTNKIPLLSCRLVFLKAGHKFVKILPPQLSIRKGQKLITRENSRLLSVLRQHQKNLHNFTNSYLPSSSLVLYSHGSSPGTSKSFSFVLSLLQNSSFLLLRCYISPNSKHLWVSHLWCSHLCNAHIAKPSVYFSFICLFVSLIYRAPAGKLGG